MLDFWRNWIKSAEEKRLEALNAYLDGSLTPRQQEAFEAELAQDEALRVELDQLRLVRENLRQLPRRRSPRNFTLDPAMYGRPQREPLVRAYPVLRMATVLTAFFFVLAIALQTFTPGGLLAPEAQVAEVTRVVSTSDEVAMEPAAEAPTAAEAAPMMEGEVIVVTRVVSEAVSETVIQTEIAVEEMAEEPVEAPVEEMAEEAAADMAGPSSGPVGTAVPVTRTAPLPTATLSPSPTPSPTNTPDIPRLPTEEPTTERAGGAEFEQNGLKTAVPSPTPAPQTSRPTPTTAFPWLSVSLGALFVLLAALTFVARRRLL